MLTIEGWLTHCTGELIDPHRQIHQPRVEADQIHEEERRERLKRNQPLAERKVQL